MAISNLQHKQILGVVAGLFGAAPGQDYLTQIIEVIEASNSVKEASIQLGNHHIFKDDVLGGASQAQQIAIIMGHFGLNASGAGKADTEAKQYVTDELAAGKGWGEIVYNGVLYLLDSNVRAPEFNDAAQLLNNMILVSDIYSESNTSTDLAFLQSMLKDVTKGNPSTESDAENYVHQHLPPPPPPPSQILELTTGIDRYDIHDGDVVTGDSSTWNPGDSVTGHSGTVNLFLDDALDESGTLNTIDVVNVDPGLTGVNDGVVRVNAQNWDNIGQLNIVKTEAPAVVQIVDIQGTSIPNILVDDLEPGASITLDFDGQDLNASGKTVNIAVREAKGTVSVINDDNLSATETINLNVQDTAGYESVLEDFVGDGTKVLNIDGGAAGIDFEITGALDAGIETLDASGLLSNASLNVSDSTKTMTVTLGGGNDVLYMGDTLFDDTLHGGAGDDELDVNLTNNATRMPTMDGFETLTATFNAAVTFDARNVNDLETANVRASAGRADFNRMDETFKTVNILGDLDQGIEVDYAPHVDNIETNLTVNIEGDTARIGNAGNDYGIQTNANIFALNHNGDSDVEIDNGIKVDDSGSTTQVSIINNSDFDLEIDEADAGSVIVDGNAVRDLLVQTNGYGDIIAPPEWDKGAHGDLMDEAAALQNYTVESADNSDIVVGRVGRERAAIDLETVTISAGAGSRLDVGAIDAEGQHDDVDEDRAATIDQIAVEAGRNSDVRLHNSGDHGYGWGEHRETSRGQWLDAASVNQMTVTAAAGATIDGDTRVFADFAYASKFLNDDEYDGTFPWDFGGGNDYYNNWDFNGLIDLELNAQAANSVLTVSGAGRVSGFFFEDNNFSKVDATGLTGGTGLVVFHGEPWKATGFEFLGSEYADYVIATEEDDTLEGNGGNDVLAGLAGNDVINGGDGDDILFGDVSTCAFNWWGDENGNLSYWTQRGNDIINGGAGQDVIVGGRNADIAEEGGSLFAGAYGDVLTGGTNEDEFVFAINSDCSEDTGKSGGTNMSGVDIWQDIITDYAAGGAGDRIIFDVNGECEGDDTFQIAYFDNVSADKADYGTQFAEYRIVMRRGEYQDDGSFTPGTVQGAAIDGMTDIQLLVKTDGDSFNYVPVFPGTTDVFGELQVGGGNAFAAADHEIGLIGAYNRLGSITDTQDFIFV